MPDDHREESASQPSSQATAAEVPTSADERPVSSEEQRPLSTIRFFAQLTTEKLLSYIPFVRLEQPRSPSRTSLASPEQSQERPKRETGGQGIASKLTDTSLANSDTKNDSTTTTTSNVDQSLMEELLCPICHDMLNEVQTTKCGHSFCHSCITTHLAQMRYCPLCRSVTTLNDLHPNFVLRRIIYSKKAETPANTSSSKRNMEQLLNSSLEQTVGSQAYKSTIRQELLYEFLDMLKERNVQQMQELQMSNQYVQQDIDLVTDENSVAITRVGGKRKYSDITNDAEDPTQKSTTFPLSANLASNTQQRSCSPASTPDTGLKRRVKERYFTFEHIYKSITCPQDTIAKRRKLLTSFSDTLYQIARCEKFQSVGTFCYSESAQSSVASALAFDRDQECFAAGGLSKSILLFKTTSANSDSGITHPLQVLRCDYKISCIAMSPYIKAQLVSADYSGHINVFDVQGGTKVASFQEHKKRAWTVDISQINPQLLISGGDDLTVKIWDLKSHFQGAEQSIQFPGNVCCAQFATDRSDQILVSCADRTVSLYDLRYPKTPVKLYRGHEKAVSYARWLNKDQFVSASVDSSLKLWAKESGECLETYSGHKNEKNFVGLAVQGDWIACGSETNQVYLYHKTYNLPITSYRLPTALNNTRTTKPIFVSSLCWKRDTQSLLAANSSGLIQVLKFQNSSGIRM